MIAARRRAEKPAGSGTAALACVADEVTRETVARAFAQLGWSDAQVVEGDLAAAAKRLEQGPAPALLLLDVGDGAGAVEALQSMAELCTPETRVLAIGRPNDIVLYRRLVTLGVADYLVKPVSAELLADAAQRVMRPAETVEPKGRARLVAVIAARGGSGATTVAAGVGWCLARKHGKTVALLDADLQFGTLALSFDLDPGRGLREVLERPERLDGLLLGTATTGPDEKLRILAAEEALEDNVEITPEAMDALLAALAPDYDLVVADLPRRLDPAGRRLLGVADEVVIVTDMTLAGMRDTQRLVGLMNALRGGAAPLVVANRVGSGIGELGRADFEKGIGCALLAALPWEPKTAATMAERARTLPEAAPSAKAAAELRRLAERLCGTKPQKPRSVFRRLWG